MRLSKILYCLIPFVLLWIIGCANPDEKKANELFDEALVLIRSGLYDQALETIDSIVNNYPKTELADRLVHGEVTIKGYTYKVFKNNIAPTYIAKEEMRLIGRALEIYAEDNGAYPTNEQGLNALIKKPTLPPQPKNWHGPYIKRTDFNDPWRNPYQYKLRLKYLDQYYCDLYSYGPNGKEGGDDDIHR